MILQSRRARRKILQFPGAKKRESLLRDGGRRLTAREISHFFFRIFDILREGDRRPPLALRGMMSIWDAITRAHGWGDL